MHISTFPSSMSALTWEGGGLKLSRRRQKLRKMAGKTNLREGDGPGVWDLGVSKEDVHVAGKTEWLSPLHECEGLPSSNGVNTEKDTLATFTEVVGNVRHNKGSLYGEYNSPYGCFKSTKTVYTP